jgi:surfeit locus 1 family protein
MRFQFKFTWIPFVAMLIVVVSGIALGRWQTGRAEQKLAVQSMMEARQHQTPIALNGLMHDIAPYTRVTATGRFDAAGPIYLDNRPYQGQAGFYVVMPFTFANSDQTVMVLRGWLPRDPAERTRIAPYLTPEGDVQIEGVIKSDAGQVMALGEPESPIAGAIVQNLTLSRIADERHLSLMPYVFMQTQGDKDGLIRDWPAPEMGADKHRGYALQWYALALTAFIFYIVTGFKRAK